MKMKIKRTLLILMSVVLVSPAIAEQADDPNTFQVETISMKFKPGKNLEDVLSLREKFADFANAGDIQFGSRILVPWAVSKAALPDDQDWDALWIGFSPNTGEYSKALGYYLDNGDSFNADFDAVRTNVGTTLMGGEAVFRSEARSGDGVGATLFRTCKLKSKQTMNNAKKAMVAMSEKLKAGGSKGATFFWNPGPGSPPSMEDSFLITRWFPSVEAWGESAMAYQNGDMTKVEAGVNRVMDCSAFRLYLNYPFYMRDR
tara:strand:- start:125 stop:901 length:777 start_codon:yes stop_codon:yes gene_type:complete